MKITHFSNSDSQGGAARAALRVHQGLLKQEHYSFFLVGQKGTNEPGVEQVAISGGVGSRQMETAFQGFYVGGNRTNRSNTLFTFDLQATPLPDHPAIEQAEIFQLYWINNFLSVFGVGELLRKGKPVVWRLSDQWPFTGGCHYTAGCEKYKNFCQECPQLKQDPFAMVGHAFNEKKQLWIKDNLTIVAPSRWMLACVKQSALFRNCRCEYIPSGLDLQLWKPLAKNLVRQKWGIEENAFVLLFLTQKIGETRKGWREFAEAMRLLAQQQPEMVKRLVALKVGEGIIQGMPESLNCIDLGPVYDNAKLAEIYSMSDVFALPVLEDNLPSTLLESLACGTPVLAFATGGTVDFIRHGENGWLVDPGNVKDFSESLAAAFCQLEKMSQIRELCRKTAIQELSLDLQTNRFLNLYTDLISQSRVLPKSTVSSAPVVSETLLKITVITVVKDAFDTITKTVQSVLTQDYPNFEYLVIDGRSTDGTLEILRSFQDPRIRLISEDDSGIYDAMNKGIRNAKGQVLNFLNADDAFHHESVLSEIQKAFLNNSKFSVVYTDSIDVLDDGRQIQSKRPAPLPLAWFRRTNICHQAMFIRKEAFERVGYYDLTFQLLSDFDWNMRALKNGEKFAYLPIFSVYYYAYGAHFKNQEKNRQERSIIEMIYLDPLPIDTVFPAQNIFYSELVQFDEKSQKTEPLRIRMKRNLTRL